MVKKTAGTGSTYSIHAEICNQAVSDEYDFTILPADFYYCACIMEIMQAGSSLCRDFIFNDISSDMPGNQMPATACDGGSCKGDVCG